MDSNGVPETNGTETKVSRRSVLRGATAAGIVGTGALAQVGVSTGASGNCNEDLGNSMGTRCNQDYWNRAFFDSWENCNKDYDTYDLYHAYQNNFNLSWTGQDGSNYYFATSSGAQSYCAEQHYTDEMCNNEGDSTMVDGTGRATDFKLTVKMRGGNNGTQLVAHTDYVRGGGMGASRWNEWVENEGGKDYDMCEVHDKFVEEDYNDEEVPYWEQGLALGISAAVGQATLLGGVAIGALPIIAQMAGEAGVSKTVCDKDDSLEASWDTNGRAQLTHSAKFNVDMSPDQSGDVKLDVTQEYSTQNSGWEDDSNAYNKIEHTVAIPSNECDPYIYSESISGGSGSSAVTCE